MEVSFEVLPGQATVGAVRNALYAHRIRKGRLAVALDTVFSQAFSFTSSRMKSSWPCFTIWLSFTGISVI